MKVIIFTMPLIMRLVGGGLLSTGFGSIIWNLNLFDRKSETEESWFKFLADSPLQSATDSNQKQFKARELWKSKTVLILALRKASCPSRQAAAAKVSSLVKPELDKRGVMFYGVTGTTQNIGGLTSNLKGEVFLDVEQRFFQSKMNSSDSAEKKNEQLFDGVFLIHSGNIIHSEQVETLRADMNVDDVLSAVSQLTL